MKMPGTRRQRTYSAVILLGTLAAIGAFTLLLLPPGCSGGSCDAYYLDARDLLARPPTPSPQCGAGFLCYNGQCRRSCQAGAESATLVCTSDDDCEDPTFPHCVTRGLKSYCSSCESDENCVPVLNICAPVTSVEIPEPARGMVDPSSVPPQPLDAGPIDGYTFGRDAEAIFVPNIPITHTGTVYAIVHTTGTVSTTTMGVEMYDITSSGRFYGFDRLLDDECELSPRAVYVLPPVPINFGDVRVFARSGRENSLRVPIDFRFEAGAYRPVQTVPPDNLRLSTLEEEGFLDLEGAAVPNLVAAWPRPKGNYHVPFVLRPSPETAGLVQNGITVPANPADLVFTWEVIPPHQARTGDAVEVEILGRTQQLRCRYSESQLGGAQKIDIPAGMLIELRTRDNLTPGTQLSWEFRRRFVQHHPAEGPTPDGGMVNRVADIAVVISHTFRSTIRFQ